MHWLRSEGKLNFSSWGAGVMGEGICATRELKQVTLLCLSGLHVTHSCRTGAQLWFTCVMLCRLASAPHWHQEEPSIEMWEAQAQPLFLTQGLSVFFGVPCTLQGCSLKAVWASAAGARGFPRDVWMLVGAPRTCILIFWCSQEAPPAQNNLGLCRQLV